MSGRNPNLSVGVATRPDTDTLHLRLAASLKARAKACAALADMTPPELVRQAIRDKCDAIEKADATRRRDEAKRAADEREQQRAEMVRRRQAKAKR